MKLTDRESFETALQVLGSQWEHGNLVLSSHADLPLTDGPVTVVSVALNDSKKRKRGSNGLSVLRRYFNHALNNDELQKHRFPNLV